MKKFFTILAVLVAGSVYSQECSKQEEANYGADENECKKNVSLYSEPLKQKNYKDAAIFWWRAQKACPQYKPNLYMNGTAIYTKRIKNSEGDAKKALVDTLFMVYDEWVKNFGDCYEIKMEWASDRSSFMSDDFEGAYNKFKDAFPQYPENELKASWVQKYFASAYSMVRAGKAECDMLLDTYDYLSGICDRQSKAGDKNFEKAQGTLDKYVAPCASCDKLEELFKPKFEADPENVDLMKKVVNMMSARKCTDSEFYFAVVVKLDEKEPSYDSKKGIGIKYYNDKDYSKAIPYFEKALEMTEDADEKAKLYELMANAALAKGSYKQAVDYARNLESCDYNAFKAKACALSAPNCGNNNVERSYAYCLALDYAEKSCGKISSSTVSGWKQRLSTSQDIFFVGGKVGEEVTVSCWGEKTMLRAKE